MSEETEILEAYQLAEPHLAAPPEQEAEIPREAFRSHAVVYIHNARVGGEISIRSNSFALVRKRVAKEMIAQGDARGETVSERNMAIENGHRRDPGQKPHAKSQAAQAVPIEDDEPPAEAPKPEAQAEAEAPAEGKGKGKAKKGGDAAKG